MAKAKPPSDTDIVDGLRQVLDGQPMRGQASGAKVAGIFPSGAAGKKLLSHAVDQGWLEECPDPNPPAKAPKTPVVFARITSEGRAWVMGQLSLKPALEAVSEALKQQAATVANEAEGSSTAEALLANLHVALEEVTRAVRAVDAEQRQRGAEQATLLNEVRSLVEQAMREDGTATSTASPLSPRIAEFVREWHTLHRAGCPFQILFAELQKTEPNLTIGQFHDLLRKEKEAGRVALSGWSKTIDELPDAKLAMLIPRTVLYYAHPPGT